MSDKFVYIPHNHKKIGVVQTDTSSATDQYTTYDGSARLHYTKFDDELTTDVAEPSFSANYHMALVWGTLVMMGYMQYLPLYDRLIKCAKSTKSGKKVTGVLRHYFY